MKDYIFICEKDPDLAEICKIIFEKQDFEAIICQSSEELFSMLATMKPSLILMEILFPTLGGEKATIKLKTDNETKDIPVILFSVIAHLDVVAAKIGADGYLEKPFEVNDLISIVNEKMKRIP
ncbi:MAG: PleD family two-component system response regulator [Chitinophagales bacterium]